MPKYRNMGIRGQFAAHNLVKYQYFDLKLALHQT